MWYYQFTKEKGIQWSVDHRGIKLLEHAMKAVERIFEDRIREQIDIDDMQFGFMKDKGTTDVCVSFYLTCILKKNVCFVIVIDA